jgi:hypothetical protein
MQTWKRWVGVLMRKLRSAMPVLWAWGGVLLAAAVMIHPLFGLPVKGDDIFLHVYRIPILNSLWSQGVWFTRWVPDLIYGYGSPLFNFYPPLSAYLLTIFYWLVGANAGVAINFFLAIAMLAAASGMFYLGQLLYGQTGGLLTAAAYLFSPYLLLQAYVRGSLSNMLALALFPWTMWGLLRVAKHPSVRRVLITAVFITLLFLSHIVSSFLFVGPLAVMGIVTALTMGKELRRQRLTAVLVALFLGMALSAFFWLPAMQEIQFTQYSSAAGEVDYRQYFANSWDWPDTTVAGLSNAILPKSVGLVQQSGSGLLTIWAVWQLVIARKAKPKDTRPNILILTIAAGMMGLALLFLSAPVSNWVWSVVVPLRGLQFPWRLLDIPAFFLPLVCGSVVLLRIQNSSQSLNPSHSKLLSITKYGVWGTVIIIGFANALPFLYPTRLTSLPIQPTLADVTSVQQQFHIYGLTAWGEYSSSAVTSWPTQPPFTQADAGASLAEKLQDENLRSSVTRSDPWLFEMQRNFSQKTPLLFETHTFPGWMATIDDEPVPITPTAQGKLRVVVPAGEHHVRVWFGYTAVRQIANIISGVALVLLLIGLFWSRTTQPPANPLPAVPPVSAKPLFIIFMLLLIIKIVWLDRANSPFVTHPVGNLVPDMPVPTWRDFGEIQIAGSRISAPDRLTLYWVAPERPSYNYTIAVTLVDARGVPVKTLYNAQPGYNVTTTWEPGQFTRDDYILPIDQRDAPAGYRVMVAVLEAGSQNPLPLLDSPDKAFRETAVGTLKRPPLRDTPVSATAQPVGTLFGEAIELAQVDIPNAIQAGEALPMQFVWVDYAAVALDYTLFMHLLRPDGTFVKGNDAQPLDGLYPTSFWEPGEQIVDNREWLLDVPPGTYILQIGLYDLSTGSRLPVSGAHAELGDRVIIQELVIR